MEFWRWVKCQWDRVAAFIAFVTGLLSLLLGWIGISGATLPSQQIPYLASETVLGLFALGTAATLWLSADLHDEWRVLDDIRQRMIEDEESLMVSAHGRGSTRTVANAAALEGERGEYAATAANGRVGA
jgi:hypothetical protein